MSRIIFSGSLIISSYATSHLLKESTQQLGLNETYFTQIKKVYVEIFPLTEFSETACRGEGSE